MTESKEVVTTRNKADENNKKRRVITNIAVQNEDLPWFCQGSDMAEVLSATSIFATSIW